MSYVHFLDVFDPAGLSAGLSDREAAEQSRHRRLTEPSPRLLALLTRIRRQPPDITVNVVGGQDQQPVEWVAGDPPYVTGEGANCALWTLVLPVDDDFEALQEAVPLLQALAVARGLRVYDAAAEAFARQDQLTAAAEKPAPPAAPISADELPGPSDILIVEPLAFSATLGEVLQRQPGLDIYQAVREFLREPKEYKYGNASTGRLVKRLLQAFPFATHGHSVWGGRHPLHEALFRSEGVRLIRVAPEQLETVLRQLLPLARELFLSVAVPGLSLYVDRSGDPKNFKAYPLALLEELDPNWREHRMPDDRVDALFQQALSTALHPHGFHVLDEKGAFRFAFWRPLRLGGGRQVISYGGGGLRVEVQSDRYWGVKRAVFPTIDLSSAAVANWTLSAERQRDNTDWGTYPDQGGGVASPEHILWAVEDIQRLILPKLDALQTAEDLWHLRCRPVEQEGWFPGLADLARAVAWFGSVNKHMDVMNDWLYVARVLPEEDYEQLLSAWELASRKEVTADVLTPLQTERHLPDICKRREQSALSVSKYAAALRALPQTPCDGPL